MCQPYQSICIKMPILVVKPSMFHPTPPPPLHVILDYYYHNNLCDNNKKPLRHSTKDSDIETYKGTLDNCLPLYSLNACILNCTMPVVALCLILML